MKLKGLTPTTVYRVALGLAIAALVVGTPIFYHRWHYADHKRLREVVPGKFYRSGHLTAAGLDEAVDQLKIRTVVNLQDEYPDPEMFRNFFDRSTVKEKAECEHLGVRYVHIAPDLHHPNPKLVQRPRAIDEFLRVMDDPANYPVLIHCRAGLHRTGVLTAVYRMEYQGWSVRDAFRELKANGFGDSACTSANEYVAQYVLDYQPRKSRLSNANRDMQHTVVDLPAQPRVRN